MTKTTNYQLNQWAKSDRIMMDDFNADNQKIDAALAALGGAIAAAPKIAVGSYTGSGSCGASSPRTLTFAFQPKLVIIVENSWDYLKAGTALISGQSLSAGIGGGTNSGACLGLTVSWSGNSVTWYGPSAEKQLDMENTGYFYCAIG